MPGGFRVSLQGEAELIAKLSRLEGIAHQGALKAVRESVERVRTRAVEGIANGPKTGAVYTQLFATSQFGGVFAYGSRPPHQASAPGEYPAADTGNLMRSIWAEVEEGLALALADAGEAVLTIDEHIGASSQIHGTIGADADYAAPLEYKPPERGGRPFLRRALAESGAEIHDLFLAELAGKFRP